MPELLKMTQTALELSEEAKTSIVSRKKNLTLQQYWQKYELQTESNKHFNAAALIKKYNYLEKLNSIVPNTIQINSTDNLPAPYFQMVSRYAQCPKLTIEFSYQLMYDLLISKKQEPSQLKPEALKYMFAKVRERELFRRALRRLEAFSLEKILYGNTTDPVQEYDWPSHSHLKNRLILLRSQYLLPQEKLSEEEFEHFRRLYYLCKIVVECMEEFSVGKFSLDYEYAYKLYLFFFQVEHKNTPFSQFDLFLKKFNSYKEKNTFHMALKGVLPEDAIDLTLWKRIIWEHGPKAFSALKVANRITTFPVNSDEFVDLMLPERYRQYRQYPELARLCHAYSASEEVFDACLKYIPLIKKIDSLPDVIVDGSDLQKPGYFLMKLPIQDPRAFILGFITKCCQSISKNAQQCVIDGLTLENNGFYVLLKKKTKESHKLYPPLVNGHIDYERYEIKGQGYAWLSREGNFVIDSWENRHQKSNKVVVPLLIELAKRITHLPNRPILSVIIGTGGRTPELLAKNKIIYPEKPLEGVQYADSQNQALIYQNEVQRVEIIKNVHSSVKKIIPEKNLLSVKQMVASSDAFIPRSFVYALDALIKNPVFKEYVSEEQRLNDFCILYNQVGLIVWKFFFEIERANLLTFETLPLVTHKIISIEINEADLVLLLENFAKLNDYQLLNKELLITFLEHSKRRDWLAWADYFIVYHQAQLFEEACPNFKKIYCKDSYSKDHLSKVYSNIQLSQLGQDPKVLREIVHFLEDKTIDWKISLLVEFCIVLYDLNIYAPYKNLVLKFTGQQCVDSYQKLLDFLKEFAVRERELDKEEYKLLFKAIFSKPPSLAKNIYGLYKIISGTPELKKYTESYLKDLLPSAEANSYFIIMSFSRALDLISQHGTLNNPHERDYLVPLFFKHPKHAEDIAKAYISLSACNLFEAFGEKTIEVSKQNGMDLASLLFKLYKNKVLNKARYKKAYEFVNSHTEKEQVNVGLNLSTFKRFRLLENSLNTDKILTCLYSNPQESDNIRKGWVHMHESGFIHENNYLESVHQLFMQYPKQAEEVASVLSFLNQHDLLDKYYKDIISILTSNQEHFSELSWHTRCSVGDLFNTVHKEQILNDLIQHPGMVSQILKAYNILFRLKIYEQYQQFILDNIVKYKAESIASHLDMLYRKNILGGDSVHFIMNLCIDHFDHITGIVWFLKNLNEGKLINKLTLLILKKVTEECPQSYVEVFNAVKNMYEIKLFTERAEYDFRAESIITLLLKDPKAITRRSDNLNNLFKNNLLDPYLKTGPNDLDTIRFFSHKTYTQPHPSTKKTSEKNNNSFL